MSNTNVDNPIMDEPGSYELIDKTRLHVDETYQRSQSMLRVRHIRANFSWTKFGVLIAAARRSQDDVRYYVTDGGHRLAAAMQRDDVDLLPCLVFRSSSRAEEAGQFVDVNNERVKVSPIITYQADLIAKRPDALAIQSVLDPLGLRVSGGSDSFHVFGAIIWARKAASTNFKSFESVLTLAVEICSPDDKPVNGELLKGIWWLHQNLQGGINYNSRFRERILKLSSVELVREMNKLAAETGQAKSGAICGRAILHAVNSRLRTRIKIKPRKEDESDDSFGGD